MYTNRYESLRAELDRLERQNEKHEYEINLKMSQMQLMMYEIQEKITVLQKALVTIIDDYLTTKEIAEIDVSDSEESYKSL